MEQWKRLTEHFVFNSTDLIVLGTDQASVSVYTWNHGMYSLHVKITMKNSKLKILLVNSTFMALPNAPQIRNTDFVIENIIPGDFTFDGKLDLLIMGRKNPSHANDEILMRIYKGNGNDTIGKGSCVIQLATMANSELR